MDFTTLLDNIYTQINTKEIEMLVLPNPDIEKTTVRLHWKNVKQFLNLTHTPKDHLFDYIQTQTGKKMDWFSDSLKDGLIIHDKKISKNDIISLMKKYVETYIICNICKKGNTTMERNNTIKKYKITCNDCLAEYIL